MSPTDAEPRRAILRRFGGAWPAPLLGLLCYANTLGNGFTYDDNAIVRANPRIRSLTNFREIWLTDWWYERSDDAPIQDPARDRLYRPLTLFTFALNYAVHEVRPIGYHLVNVALHAGVCWLVWCFASRLFHDGAIAGIAAALFAVHPVHTEAVAGIVGRGEILASGFLLLGLLLLLPRSDSPDLRRILLAAPAFFAALLAKETAICFPAVALVTLHAANRGRASPLRRWLRHAGLLLLPVAVYLPLRYFALEGRLIRSELTSTLFNPLQDVDLAGRLHGPLTVLGHYARLLLVPNRLSCDYGLAVMNPRAGPEFLTLVGGLAAAALVVALLGYARRSVTWRRLAVLSAMFIASYALISNTLLLIGVSLAERLMYWPSVPVILAVAIGVVAGGRKWCGPDGPLRERAPLLRVGGLLLLLALGLRSVVRNTDWKSDETLFKADLGIPLDWGSGPSIAPQKQSAHLDNALAKIVIGHAIDAAAAGDSQAAGRWLVRAEGLLANALRSHSRYAEALKHLGSIHLLRGEEKEALRYYESALRLNPTDKTVQQYLSRLRGETPANTARAAELRRAINDKPDDTHLRLELARVLVALGRNYEALEQCEEAVRRAPGSTAALRAYGETLALNLQNEQALEVLLDVLRRDPDDWQTHANVATLLETRDPVEALSHAQRAFDLQPNNLQTQLGLAEALRLNGHVDEALKRLRMIERGLPPDDPFRKRVTDRIMDLERSRP